MPNRKCVQLRKHFENFENKLQNSKTAELLSSACEICMAICSDSPLRMVNNENSIRTGGLDGVENGVAAIIFMRKT